MGVQVLKSNAPPPPASEPPSMRRSTRSTTRCGTLSTIHKTPFEQRRGRRVDLAAVIWEGSREARCPIEPGGGTEVFGDEGELRRMLHLLVGHGRPVSSNHPS